jgi:hypothetical protein
LLYALVPGVVHHGGRGATAATMVHWGWFVCFT